MPIFVGYVSMKYGKIKSILKIDRLTYKILKTLN